MRRHCARPGCNGRATVTFTFNAHQRAVWLDAPRDGAPSAGELCDRHARSLTPPHGWTVDDRRQANVRVATNDNGTGHEDAVHPSEMRPPLVSPPAAPGIESPIREELRQLLDARSPLLGHAFLSAGEV